VARLSELTEEEIVWRDWLTNHEEKLIMLDDFEGPQDILSLLHEIGHARNDTQEEIRERNQAREEYQKALIEGDKKKETLWIKKIARLISPIERRNWAYAVRTLRKICRETDLEIKDFFPNSKEMQRFIKRNLRSFKGMFYQVALEASFIEELDDLFDKSKNRNI
jgi:hypothetical protein